MFNLFAKLKVIEANHRFPLKYTRLAGLLSHEARRLQKGTEKYGGYWHKLKKYRKGSAEQEAEFQLLNKRIENATDQMSILLSFLETIQDKKFQKNYLIPIIENWNEIMSVIDNQLPKAFIKRKITKKKTPQGIIRLE